jgi:hypothetical protein
MPLPIHMVTIKPPYSTGYIDSLWVEKNSANARALAIEASLERANHEAWLVAIGTGVIEDAVLAPPMAKPPSLPRQLMPRLTKAQAAKKAKP